VHVVIGACAFIGRDVQGAGGGKLERVARGWKAGNGALGGSWKEVQEWWRSCNVVDLELKVVGGAAVR
jgi:hypothetical protein